ncbi:receptor-type tyrosine-protein phosphatase delta, partial [Nephila pilipes]
PFAPVGVSEEYVTNSSIVVKWNEPQPFYGPIISYTIKWNKKSDLDSFNASVESANYTIENLLPYTEYSIQVKARTEAGFGPWSTALIVLTDVGRNSSVQLSWWRQILHQEAFCYLGKHQISQWPLGKAYCLGWEGSAISEVLVIGTDSCDGLIPHKGTHFKWLPRQVPDWDLIPSVVGLVAN